MPREHVCRVALPAVHVVVCVALLLSARRLLGVLRVHLHLQSVHATRVLWTAANGRSEFGLGSLVSVRRRPLLDRGAVVRPTSVARANALVATPLTLGSAQLGG